MMQNVGCEMQDQKISHLLYMDDLNTYARNYKEQKKLFEVLKTFGDDIKMKLGLDKYAKVTFNKGKLTETASIKLDINSTIKELEQEESYRYLGINETDDIQHAQVKEEIRIGYYRRVGLVLKSELNAANRIQAVSNFAVHAAAYSFNVINWQMSEIRKMDVKIRKLLTCERMHHPQADVDWLCVPRNKGVRGYTTGNNI